jgi:lipopolysaccharide heptosyltransferase II
MNNRLVIMAPNWLGDAVMALPAIGDVRRGAPAATVAIAARPAIAPLFQLVRGIDETIVLDQQTWRAAAAELGARAFDSALLLPNSVHAALIAYRGGIAQRWGYRTQLRGPLLTRAIDPPAGVHQVEYYQQLVHALGFPHGDIEPRLAIADTVRDAGARLLIESGWNRRAPLAAIAPGAAYGGAKRWPPEYFADLASGFASDGVRTVMIGSAADAATAREVVKVPRSPKGLRHSGPAVEHGSERVPQGFSPAIIDLVGKTDLPTLAGVLTHCRALVTNDSGAMHLAAAAGVPVTAVFGPTNELATRPIGDAHAIVTNDVWCRPCMLRECPLDHRCLRGVSATSVAAAVRRTL